MSFWTTFLTSEVIVASANYFPCWKNWELLGGTKRVYQRPHGAHEIGRFFGAKKSRQMAQTTPQSQAQYYPGKVVSIWNQDIQDRLVFPKGPTIQKWLGGGDHTKALLPVFRIKTLIKTPLLKWLNTSSGYPMGIFQFGFPARPPKNKRSKKAYSDPRIRFPFPVHVKNQGWLCFDLPLTSCWFLLLYPARHCYFHT